MIFNNFSWPEDIIHGQILSIKTTMDLLKSQYDENNIENWYKNFTETMKNSLEIMKNFTVEEKKLWAPIIMANKKIIDDFFQEYKKNLQNKILENIHNEKLEVLLTQYDIKYGSLHPLRETIMELWQILNSMGFALTLSPLMATESNNFDDLNFPPHHPARDMQDTFFLDNDLMLRTHTSTAQIEVLKNEKPPIKIFSIGPVFRNETIDSTHNSMFFQMEIMYINDDANVLSLKGTIQKILEKFFERPMEIRFRTSFFPFVVPGFEVDVLFNNEWLEIAGCGIIHPNVIKINQTSNLIGFAAGFGIDRLHMIKHNIKDIRDLYINQKYLYKWGPNNFNNSFLKKFL